jgi:hypothetical protein
MRELVDNQRPVIGRVVNTFPDESSQTSIYESMAMTHYAQDFIRAEDRPEEPMTAIFYPMVDTAADHVSLFDEATGAPTDNHTTVGVISLFFYWRDLLRDLLRDEDEGIFCVIENPCNQTFTYELRGENPVYLGRGDLHDTRYDGMHHSLKFEDFASQSSTGRQYTGSPLAGGACPYTLHIYSSATREDSFTTDKPKILTVAVILIFVFTSAMFVIYDQCVERRQHKIMYAASQSKANIALLEEMVHERTKKLEEANQRLEEANRCVV